MLPHGFCWKDLVLTNLTPNLNSAFISSKICKDKLMIYHGLSSKASYFLHATHPCQNVSYGWVSASILICFDVPSLLTWLHPPSNSHLFQNYYISNTGTPDILGGLDPTHDQPDSVGIWISTSPQRYLSFWSQALEGAIKVFSSLHGFHHFFILETTVKIMCDAKVPNRWLSWETLSSHIKSF